MNQQSAIWKWAACLTVTVSLLFATTMPAAADSEAPVASGPTYTSYQGTNVSASAVVADSAPISPQSTKYPDNQSLSQDQIAARFATIGASYAPGQALTLDDLEFVRAYGTPLLLAPSLPAANSSTANAIANETVGGLGGDSIPFNDTKTASGVTVKLAGKFVQTLGTFSNSWSISMTGSATAGGSKVKTNEVYANYQAYGVVAKWPYVGLIYSKTYSATASGANTVSQSRGDQYAGVEVSSSISAYQLVTLTSGSKIQNPTP